MTILIKIWFIILEEIIIKIWFIQDSTYDKAEW